MEEIVSGPTVKTFFSDTSKIMGDFFGFVTRTGR